jgi:hypothetical protein
MTVAKPVIMSRQNKKGGDEKGGDAKGETGGKEIIDASHILFIIQRVILMASFKWPSVGQ